MAVRMSRATGAWLTAGTWGLVDATSFSNTQAASSSLLTTYGASSTFTPGAITIDGVAIKLSVRTGTTGTFSIHLAIAGVEVPGTLVTINTADFPVAATADLNGGWHFFKFAAPVLLVAATAYAVECKTSSTNMIGLYCSSGTNWDRALVTTTTGAPAASDDAIICGEYTGAGTSNSFVVTYDETATTDYGSTPTAVNSLIQPGVAVCNKGTFLLDTAAATNYNLKLSNSFLGYSGGTINFGTVATPMPRGSTFTLQFDCGANVDYGIIGYNLSTWTGQALSRTSGKNITKCLLNTDEAANSTSLGVDTDTGWLDNDLIAVAATTRTSTQSEQGALNGNAGASTLTVDGFAGSGGGVLNAHSGTAPTQAEVIMLTRSILIEGASASLQAYIRFAATSNVDFDWVEFKWLGSATAVKRGMDIQTTTGTFTADFCSFHDWVVASSAINFSGVSGNGYTFSNNVVWLIATGFISAATSATAHVVDNNIFMRNTDSANIVSLGDVGGTFTNNTMISAVNLGFVIQDSNGVIGTMSGNTVHTNAQGGMNPQQYILGTILNTKIWRNNSTGFTMSNSELTMDTVEFFGNAIADITTGTTMQTYIWKNVTSNGDSTFSTPDGVRLASVGGGALLVFEDCDFGTASGIKVSHSTADFNIAASSNFQIKLVNTKLASATEVATQSNLSPLSFLSSQKHDQTAGLHKTWKRYGTITIEVTTVHTGGQSMKMTPNNASFKLDTTQGLYGGFKVAVANGATVTPTVYVYEDAAYNGARARLIVKRNVALGITSDTVLDTATAASDAAWEALTGTTAAVTDDGVLEFVVDCDGTAGNLFVDSFSAA